MWNGSTCKHLITGTMQDVWKLSYKEELLYFPCHELPLQRLHNILCKYYDFMSLEMCLVMPNRGD